MADHGIWNSVSVRSEIDCLVPLLIDRTYADSVLRVPFRGSLTMSSSSSAYDHLNLDQQNAQRFALNFYKEFAAIGSSISKMDHRNKEDLWMRSMD